MRFTSIRQLLELTEINAKAAGCLGKSGALSNLDDELNEPEAEEYSTKMVGYLRSLRAFEKKLGGAAEQLGLKSTEEVEQAFEEANQLRVREWEAEASRRIEINKEKEANGKKLLKIPERPTRARTPKRPEEVILPRISISQRERVNLQREVLNLYLTGHPLDEVPPDKSIVDIRWLEELEENSECTIRGVLLSYKVSSTRRKQLMARLRIEDKTGSIEVVAFPALYSLLQGTLKEGELYRVSGQIDRVTNIDQEGNEQAHIQFKALRVSMMKLGNDKDWDVKYPLLKGLLRILPGKDRVKSKALGIITSYARRQ